MRKQPKPERWLKYLNRKISWNLKLRYSMETLINSSMKGMKSRVSLDIYKKGETLSKRMLKEVNRVR